MNSIELLGYAAALLVIGSFYMKTMIPLRYIAVASNVTYIAYGYLAGLHPMLALHVTLLPLNVSRLMQMKRLIREVRSAVHGDLSMDWLLPFSTRKFFRKGDVISRKGDVTDSVYVIMKGEVLLEDFEVVVGEGEVVGEIGVFAPGSRRTCTMICRTDIETLAVNSDRIKELYYQNPKLGFYLTQLIVRRLLHNLQPKPCRGNALPRQASGREQG